MQPINCIIFDYGRVLVGPIDKNSFDENLTEIAREYDFATGQDLWTHIYISEAWESAKRGQISHDAFWEDRLSALSIPTDGFQPFKKRLFFNWGIYPEMRILLISLRNRYRLAILSNTSRKNFTHYIEETRGLSGYFELILSSAEEGVPKPDPAFYQIALNKLGISPEQALFVDDLPRNTQAAEKLGIPSIVFTTPGAFIAELKERNIL